MDEIAKRRAEKMQDCREWSPLDALLSLVDEIKRGEARPVNIVVHWFEDDPDNKGGKIHHWTASGVTFPEHIALLNVALGSILEKWRGRE